MRTLALFLLLLLMLLKFDVVVAEPEQKTIVIGGSVVGLREFNQQDMQIGLRSAMNDQLAEKGINIEVNIYATSQELYSAVKEGKVKLIFGTPMEFFSLEPYMAEAKILSGSVNEKNKMRLYLLVRKDSNIRNIAQIKGKSLDVPRWLIDDIGGLYLDTLLLENKFPDYKSMFASVQKSKNSNQSIINVFFNKNDVALVTESEFEIASELNPQIKLQLAVIQASEPYYSFISAATKTMDTDLMNIAKQAALNLDKTVKGKNILKLFKSSGLLETDISGLENIRNLIQKNQQLKSRLVSRLTR